MTSQFQKACAYILALCLVIAFYAWTSPSNLSESNDGYAYSYIVENSRIDEIKDSRMPLFFIITRIMFLVSQLIFTDVKALQMLSWMSIVCASASILLFYNFLLIPACCSRPAAFFGTGLLALSYGFWRYATVPEVYAPAILLTLCALLALCSVEPAALDNRRFNKQLAMMLSLGLLSGVAVLFYRPLFIVLFLAYPLSVFRSRRIFSIGAYMAGGGLIVVTGYIALYVISQTETISLEKFLNFIFRRSSEFSGNDLSTSSILGGLLAFLRMILAGYWMLGFDVVVEWVGRTFPGKQPDNVLYQAAHSGVLPQIALFLLGPLLAIFGLLAVTALRHRHRTWAGPIVTLKLWWFVIYFAFCFSLAPFSYEAYIMLIPALAGLAAVWVAEPVVAAGRSWFLASALVLFGVFNWAGGLAIVNGTESDYVKRRSEWVVTHGKPGDVVIVGPGHHETFTYVRYLTETNVVKVKNPNILKVVERALASGKHVFAFGEIIHPLKRRRTGPVGKVAEALRPRARIVHENDAGRTFEVVRQATD